MKTAQQLTDELINRIKSSDMKIYEVKREVEGNWMPQGTVPFDTRVAKGVATFTVYAVSLQDAEDQVTTWLESFDDEQD